LVLEFFCDASIGIKGATIPNQTGIGIFILTTPAISVSHAYFFQVVIPQVLEPLEAKTLTLLLGTKLAMALNLHDATLCTEVLAMAARAGSHRTHCPSTF
jgi:hypothetical protein